MISPRIWLPTLVLLGLLLTGLLTLSGEILALGLPVLIFIGASYLLAPEKPDLEIRRLTSTSAVMQGRPVRVRLEIANRGTATTSIALADEVPEGLQVTEDRTNWLLQLKPGERVEVGYTLQGRRGEYRYRSVRLAVTDPLGLFRTDIRIPVASELVILPEVLHLHPVRVRPGQTRGFAGPIPSRTGGSGIDFYGVREYQIGDPRRRINWRVSARTLRDLYTNEFEQLRIADVGLILDARHKRDLQSGGTRLFDFGVQAAASLAQAFIHDGNRVSLMIYGFGIDRVYPGYGRVQQERILQMLARAATGHHFVLEDLVYLPVRMFPPHSQLVMVSPLGPGDAPMLVRMRASGYALMVVSPNPVEFEAAFHERSPRYELAKRAADLERKSVLNSLRRVGIQVVDWNVAQSLDIALQAGLSQQPGIGRLSGGAG